MYALRNRHTGEWLTRASGDTSVPTLYSTAKGAAKALENAKRQSGVFFIDVVEVVLIEAQIEMFEEKDYQHG